MRPLFADTLSFKSHAFVQRQLLRVQSQYDMTSTLFGIYPLHLKLYAGFGYLGPVLRNAMKAILVQVDVELVKPSNRVKRFVTIPTPGCRKKRLPDSIPASAGLEVGDRPLGKLVQTFGSPQFASRCAGRLETEDDPGLASATNLG